MKHQAKLVLFGFLSLTIGVAFASPLLASELDIKPFIKHAQGPTADFSVDVVYANFTVINGSRPVSENDGPAISCFVVLNITNLSDIGAELSGVDFTAAEKITNMTGTPFPYFKGVNSSGGNGWEAEGAWVDGKWYNVTFVNGTWPYWDIDGNIKPWSLSGLNLTSYWMEGVRLYERHANGKTSIYLDMNGTWTDITGRTNVTLPTINGFSISNSVLTEFHVFQGVYENSTIADTKYTQTGQGHFDNYWEPHESRLIMLQDTRSVSSQSCNLKAIEVLKTGAVTFKTHIHNDAEHKMELPKNTVEDTWSDATEIKQVQMAQNGNSYIYNTILGENQIFITDQYGVEVFIETRP